MIKQKLAVIGLGSAGIQSLCHMLSSLDNNWEIYSIYDPKIKALGIGESTNPTFIDALQYGLNFDFFNDLKKLHATLKTGTVYKDWREHDFCNPLINGAVAIHFDTHSLKDFAIPRLKERWGEKLKVIEENILNIKSNYSFAELETSSNTLKFDYIIDCRGFPQDYTGYNICNNFVNTALVYNSKLIQNWNYTGHKATPDGWMFEVPLDNRTSYGYLFDKNFTTSNTAISNFQETINETIDKTLLEEYNFSSYYANNIFDGRILKNGNRAVFFEPMFANSLWLYNNINFYFIEYINQNLTKEQINNCFEIDATKVRDMIAFNYHGGSMYDTPFWKSTKNTATQILNNSIYFHDTQEAFRKFNHNKTHWANRQYPYWVFPPINLLTLDKNFGYNYFS